MTMVKSDGQCFIACGEINDCMESITKKLDEIEVERKSLIRKESELERLQDDLINAFKILSRMKGGMRR